MNYLFDIQCLLSGQKTIRPISSPCQNGQDVSLCQPLMEAPNSEAVQHGQEVLEMLVESALKDGEPLPSPRTHAA